VDEPAADRELTAGREELLTFHESNCVAAVGAPVFNVRRPVPAMRLKKHKSLT
jgi:hypothetical protein